MYRPVQDTHSSFIEGLHMTKNTASELFINIRQGWTLPGMTQALDSAVVVTIVKILQHGAPTQENDRNISENESQAIQRPILQDFLQL